MTSYAAGLRLSEATHLRIAEVDLDRMLLNVDSGKGANQPTTPVPMPVGACAALAAAAESAV